MKNATHWDDGTPKSAGNAFSAAPRATFTAAEKRALVSARTKAARSAKQVLGVARNQIAIGKPEDAHKRSRLRKANI